MTNAEINRKFLTVIDSKSKTLIVDSIAKNYGCSSNEILEELLDEEAENILDYMNGPERTAAYCLYQRHGFQPHDLR